VKGALGEAAETAGWHDRFKPGQWVPVERTFRDGHREPWWALEVDVGPYGPDKRRRAVVVTTDPTSLPERTSWYLVTNLPAPAREPGDTGAPVSVDLPELIHLYGLRNWVEQSYKQVKHRLGWSQYQVRSDRAIRRHWKLVCCAFCFCWWAHGRQLLADEAAVTSASESSEPAAGARKKNPPSGELAESIAAGAQLAGAMDHARALVAGMVGSTPRRPRCSGSSTISATAIRSRSTIVSSRYQQTTAK
jgi:hypothetical protein